jgi:hypothetical protein
MSSLTEGRDLGCMCVSAEGCEGRGCNCVWMTEDQIYSVDNSLIVGGGGGGLHEQPPLKMRRRNITLYVLSFSLIDLVVLFDSL